MHHPFIAQRVALGYNIHNNPVEMGARVSFDATAALLLWSAEQLRNALECGDFSVPMDDLLIGQPVDPDIEQGVIAEEALLDWLSCFGIHDPCQTLTDRVWQALVDAVSQGEPVTARLLSAHAADLLDLALVTHATLPRRPVRLCCWPSSRKPGGANGSVSQHLAISANPTDHNAKGRPQAAIAYCIRGYFLRISCSASLILKATIISSQKIRDATAPPIMASQTG